PRRRPARTAPVPEQSFRPRLAQIPPPQLARISPPRLAQMPPQLGLTLTRLIQQLASLQRLPLPPPALPQVQTRALPQAARSLVRQRWAEPSESRAEPRSYRLSASAR